ncbi:MAG: RDD family protein [Opitutales bacterium]|nr:RDD family protein [Opitutales bacterium]
MKSSDSANEIRKRITPGVFEVSPDLLNIPLATPKRRLLAMLIDLLAIAFGSLFGLGGLSLFACIMCVRAAIRAHRIPKEQREHILRRNPKAMIGFAVVFSLLALCFFKSPMDINVDVKSDTGAIKLSVKDSISIVSRLKSLDRKDAVAREIEAKQIIRELSEAGFTDQDITDLFEETFEFLNLNEEELEALNEAKASYFTELRENRLNDGAADLAYEYWRTVDENADVDTIEIARHSLRNKLAGAEIDALKAEKEELTETIEEIKAGKSISDYILALSDNLGLKIGWTLFYFMLTPAFCRGRTLGKYLMGIQIIRLDGKPLTLWNTFERAGAYYAGLGTGLLGFAQIYWDPNRQAIQDKLAGTAVIRTIKKKKEKTPPKPAETPEPEKEAKEETPTDTQEEPPKQVAEETEAEDNESRE